MISVLAIYTWQVPGFLDEPKWTRLAPGMDPEVAWPAVDCSGGASGGRHLPAAPVADLGREISCEERWVVSKSSRQI